MFKSELPPNPNFYKLPTDRAAAPGAGTASRQTAAPKAPAASPTDGSRPYTASPGTNTVPPEMEAQARVQLSIDLADMNGSRAVDCFGGRLFRTSGKHRENVIAFAIPYPSPEETNAFGDHYVQKSFFASLGLLPYAGSSRVGSQLVFTFLLSKNCVSLREILQDTSVSRDPVKARARAFHLFGQLVEFLKEYECALEEEYSDGSGEPTYEPLCCLSLDTIFVAGNGRLCFLPLLPYQGKYPACYPSEAGTPEADISTDLATAALVAVQLYSGAENESGGQRMYCPDDLPVLTQCLLPFRSWRPTLEEVLAQLQPSDPQESDPSTSRPTSGDIRGDRRGSRTDTDLIDDIYNKFRQSVTGFFGTRSDRARTLGRPEVRQNTDAGQDSRDGSN